MKISQLATSVAESATMQLNDRAKRLMAQGKPVIHLGLGEPQNPAPESAVRAIERTLQDRSLKYTAAAGMPSVRETIARQSSDAYQVSLAARNVIVCNGSKHALFNTLAAVVDPGDEVLFPAPYWVSYPEMVKLARGIGIPVAPLAGSLQPDPEAMLAAIGERTRAVILNTPNNPSGMIYPEPFVRQLVRTCEAREIYLIMDDIYRQLVFDGSPSTSVYSFTERDIEATHVIVINGLSKTYGLTGLRLGWAIGPSELIGAMNKIQSQTTSNASVLSQAAAEGALTGNQSEVAELIEQLRVNRDLMCDELNTIQGVRLETPGGGLYCFPDCSGLGASSVELCELLLDKAFVVTVPGIEFGMEGFVRLGFAGTRDQVAEGMRRVRWAFDPKQPAEISMGDLDVVRDWV